MKQFLLRKVAPLMAIKTFDNRRHHVTADDLEALAFITGKPINMGGTYPTLTVNGETWVADMTSVSKAAW